jgi:3-dehydroquinate synthase
VKRVEIKGHSGQSIIAVNESLDNVNHYLPDKRCIIITDRNVGKFYRSRFPKGKVIEIGFGEDIKNLETVESIYSQMLDLEVDRSWFLLAIGGGIVCDIAGFVASTYMRGIPFGFVSTTLLSQVDASVGGKNGVNFFGYKNIIGVFQQPSFVICDLTLLKTLPGEEYVCGFAEIIKHGAIANESLFTFLESNHQKAMAQDLDVLERLVYDSVIIKSSIVERDEKEKGERRILNFGHTIAHAIEKTMCIPHGEAVAAGMVFAAKLSIKHNLLVEKDLIRIQTLVENLGLPERVLVFKDILKDAIRMDKKREADGIHCILLNRIGEAIIKEINIAELEAAIDDLY